MTEDWTKEWERRVVNGVYPLRRYLGRSNHSVVFLTECQAQNLPQAAIKILPANPARIEAQLAHWRRVATLSHPHLIRLLDSGRCQLGGHNFLFVVTDYAEQNLAQILPGRPLTPDEVRELMPVTLDTLAYLHGKSLVHGGLKPPNFLVVDDQLKLASDTIRPAGEPTASTAKPSSYDPPEAQNGAMSAAGDMWGLGITLIEALTQAPPPWSKERSDPVALPAHLDPGFVDTVQRCLSRDPSHRPAIAELVAQFKQGPSEAPPPVAPPVMNDPLVRTLPTQSSPKTRFVVSAIALSIVAVWAVWLAVHIFRTHAKVPPSASTISPSPPAKSRPANSPTVSSPSVDSPPAVSAPAVSAPSVVEHPTASDGAPSPAVVHQEIPTLSRRTRESIRDVIKITVRVIVDRSGSVVAATLENRASSKYLGRAALGAAKKWKFTQGTDQTPRPWLLSFEFSRAGAKARAAPASGGQGGN